MTSFVDKLANEIRSIKGRYSMSAGLLAESMEPFFKAEVDARSADHAAAMAEKDKAIVELKELLGEVGEVQTAAILSREELQAKCERMEAVIEAGRRAVEANAELRTEVNRLVESHRYIVKTWPDSSSARHSRSTIARTALTETK